MKPSQTVLTTIFLLVAGVLTASIFFIYSTGTAAGSARQQVVSEISILNHLGQVISTLKDAETGQRGYLLTGQESYLQPYQTAVASFTAELDGIRKLATNGNVLASSFDNFDRLSKEKMAELAQTIQIRREQGFDAALAVVNSGQGKRTMDDLRAEMEKMMAAEREKLSQANRTADLASLRGTIAALIAGFFGLGITAVCYRRIGDEMKIREQNAVEIARQRELLHTTLASIGDGVIVTDTEGRVTFLNPEAEKLTGWRSEEAAGLALPRVFQIVNEASRQTVENPVDKVLRDGMIVGLANHTILIAKNGREIPIDDSAAPIRLADGPLFGVVLVFRDFSEHKRMEKEMTDANVRLETTVAERTTRLREMISELEHLSYAIVHDMRAPLRSMHGFASFLADDSGAWTAAQRKDFANRIMSASDRLDGLIQDALSYNKVILQEIPLGPVNLAKLVPGIIETYPNLHPDKADIIIDGPLPAVTGNEALLTQCFSNLLGNAVKFVAPGQKPRVRLRAEPAGAECRIWVEDNGIGVPKESQHRLFGMFQKLNQEYEGTGVGLALVRKVVERMGGTVGVDSEAGQGSRFWVQLHLAS